MLRSIGAVAAGYFVFGASAFLLFQLSGQQPHQAAPVAFKAASIVWGATFALVAGWLTARVAVRHQALHAGILAALIALSAIVSLASRPSDAKWSQLAALAIMAPCAVLGGVLSSRTPPQ
jgi:hypothetical protein